MEDTERDVVIVGAGFSRAVHAAFPVMSELPGLIAPKLRASSSTEALVAELRRGTGGVRDATGTDSDKKRVEGVDFEAWLSRIAEDQPHLSNWENLERRALYAHSATAIRDVLLEAERRAFTSGELERWPYELMRVLDARRTSVITMNYDRVIERLARQTLWVDTGGAIYNEQTPGRPVDANDLFDGLPPQEPASGLMSSQAATLRLLKLHGSVSWFAAPNDPTGLTLAQWAPEKAGVDVSEGFDDEDIRRRNLPGREPFLVPPSTRKSPYFDNPVIREVWYRARRALESTRRVALVGYSLPATDTIFGGMLADSIANRTVDVVVVNKCPAPVVAQLRRLGVNTSRNDPIGGEQAVCEWAKREVDRQAAVVAAELRSWAGKPERLEQRPFVSVVWAPPTMPGTVAGGAYSRQVSSPGVNVGSDLVLELRPAAKKTIDDCWPVSDLGTHLETARRIVVASPGGGYIPIIKWEYQNNINPRQTGRLDFYPATIASDWEHLSNGRFSQG